MHKLQADQNTVADHYSSSRLDMPPADFYPRRQAKDEWQEQHRVAVLCQIRQ
jgi:hypothetical protein